MAVPVRGAWKRSLVGYVGEEANWGTGIDPIHSQYGEGSPLRITGRVNSEPGGSVVSPAEAPPDPIVQENLWGYTPEENSHWTGVHYDARPDWSETTPEFRGNTGNQPAWGSGPTGLNAVFRSRMEGAHRLRQKLADALPNETVSEGWINKPKGKLADAEPSDPSQYEIQTSMRQRYEARDNKQAVARGTDDARSTIGSRVAGQKVKIYSGQVIDSNRYRDMFPYQQDQMIRPFWYRTAGTGDPAMMDPNEFYVSSPIQREPPQDPDLGTPETQIEDYGYQSGDYYA